MKIKQLLITPVFIISLLVLITGICAPAQDSLTGKIIVIDPGHGGIYPGAVHNGVREADVNLSVALKLRDRLAAAGGTVILTRDSDVNLAPPGSSLAQDLQARIDVVKAFNADIFVSLHSNADKNRNMTGIISFYPSGHPNDLAQSIQVPLVQMTGAIDGGVRPANFYVLRNNPVPAALIEMGFLTNAAESSCLKDDAYQEKLADGLAAGILAYFQSRDSNPPTVP